MAKSRKGSRKRTRKGSKKSRRGSKKSRKGSKKSRKGSKKSRRGSKKYAILAYYTNKTKLSNSNNINIIRQQGGTDNDAEWYVDAFIETPKSTTEIINWLKSKAGFKRISELRLV